MGLADEGVALAGSGAWGGKAAPDAGGDDMVMEFVVADAGDAAAGVKGAGWPTDGILDRCCACGLEWGFLPCGIF